ncbi:Transcriptional regulator, GntR family [Sinorhizobium sojae CCBAU 05684]|uniref:Transcriptional regulator, GntR family n=1 Tax=Sinorhizobium sojae CCBAU 05684 TaxID=716928 RepID=A0A249PB30_9HYPH|nr:GntR family transcriptional regulator [Sinorhizobium sojae]ASY63123.1 Transcriptional regulator, GntR family [Sinorhizobium sojae CCBAU 05684]
MQGRPLKERGKAAKPSATSEAESTWPIEHGRDLTALAYERIEALFVSMRIVPGAEIRTQDLQAMVGIGRTPVHQAVRRLAAETLLEIRPRNGLRVAPIDLSREKRLAELRRDLDRFVTAAAIRNMTSNDRAALHHLKRKLEAEGPAMTVDSFNFIDKSFDDLLIRASGERFLERVLSPLHAIGRRNGYLHLTHISGLDGLSRTVERHVAIMEAVLAGDAERACQASDELIQFGISMLVELEEQIDPALLDIRFSTTHSVAGPFAPARAGSSAPPE